MRRGIDFPFQISAMKILMFVFCIMLLQAQTGCESHLNKAYKGLLENREKIELKAYISKQNVHNRFVARAESL